MSTTIFRKRKVIGRVYEATEGTLFVPGLDMLRVHEASKPRSILKRMGLPEAWDNWRRRFRDVWPSLYEWLYSHRGRPANGMAPSQSVDKPDGITEAMEQFRKKTTFEALSEATGVPDSCFCYWLDCFEKFSWFRPWLLRGEEAPQEVTVASEGEVEAARLAWDWRGICRQVGLTPSATYVRWVQSGSIPDVVWLRWLFGQAVPPGTFLVPPTLQKLRQKMTRSAICTAAGLDRWNLRFSNNQDLQERFNEAASVASSLKRAEIKPNGYYSFLQQAKAVGALQPLEDFLSTKGLYGPKKSRQSGLIGKLFIPSPAMLRFRKKAQTLSAEIWKCRALPGFDKWFEDWTTPGPFRGRRKHLTNGVVHQPVAERHDHLADEKSDAGTTRGGIPLHAGAEKRTNGHEDKLQLAQLSSDPETHARLAHIVRRLDSPIPVFLVNKDGAAPDPQLSRPEQAIVAKVPFAPDGIRGARLAELAGFHFSAQFRTTLSSLVKRRTLTRNERGYTKMS